MNPRGGCAAICVGVCVCARGHLFRCVCVCARARERVCLCVRAAPSVRDAGRRRTARRTRGAGTDGIRGRFASARRMQRYLLVRAHLLTPDRLPPHNGTLGTGHARRTTAAERPLPVASRPPRTDSGPPANPFPVRHRRRWGMIGHGIERAPSWPCSGGARPPPP